MGKAIKRGEGRQGVGDGVRIGRTKDIRKKEG